MSEKGATRFRFHLADALVWVALAAFFAYVVAFRRSPLSGVLVVSVMYLFPVYGVIWIVLGVFKLRRPGPPNGVFWAIMLLIAYHQAYRYFYPGPIRSYPLAVLSAVALFGSFLLVEVYVYLAARRRIVAGTVSRR
jgi:hypothetical protein